MPVLRSNADVIGKLSDGSYPEIKKPIDFRLASVHDIVYKCIYAHKNIHRLCVLQYNKNQLRAIVYSQAHRQHAAAQPPAYRHYGLPFFKCAGGILRKQPLTGSNYSAYKRQAHQPAVSVARENKVNFFCGIGLKQLRTVREQHRVF